MDRIFTHLNFTDFIFTDLIIHARGLSVTVRSVIIKSDKVVSIRELIAIMLPHDHPLQQMNRMTQSKAQAVLIIAVYCLTSGNGTCFTSINFSFHRDSPNPSGIFHWRV